MDIKKKEHLYYLLAERNSNIRREYETYKRLNPDEHKKHPNKSLWKLFRLNVHYRVLKKKKSLYYSDNAKPNNANPNNANPNNARGRLPYLDGSESEAFKRQNVMHFTKGLMTYDVISFDIFDTLILRPFAKPTDLFMLIGHALRIPDFHQLRIDSEKQARKIAYENKRTYEITIEDIYEIIEKKTGLSREKGIATEFEYEKRYCFANPYMKRVYDMLIELGKTIVITSDMYLPHDMMEELLSNAGYNGYKKLYVSCDYNKSKRSGELYDIVKDDNQNKTIIHVGDNWVPDITSAKSRGLEAKYYKNCHEIGNKYRSEGMSELIGSAYAGIINTHLHNGTNTYNPYYEYGFIYGGLYVLGYCNWIHEKCKKEGIDKVLFLARDGAIYQKVFNMLYDDVPNEYVLWSRIANAKYSLESNKNDFIRKVILYRAYNKTALITLEQVFTAVDLQCLIEKLKDYDLKPDYLLTTDNMDIVEKLLIDNWDMVIKSMEPQKLACKQYISKCIGSARKVAVVDVGWGGSGPLGIKNMVENEFKFDCEVKCYLAGFRINCVTDNLTYLMDNTIEPYMFSRIYNQSLYMTHKNTNKGLNNIFFEMFTQNPTPSFAGWTNTNHYVFDMPEIENYIGIKDIHKGIYEFANIYTSTFKNDNVMSFISGWDAYCSFKFIYKNLKLIKSIFGSFTYARGIGFDGMKLKDLF